MKECMLTVIFFYDNLLTEKLCEEEQNSLIFFFDIDIVTIPIRFMTFKLVLFYGTRVFIVSIS